MAMDANEISTIVYVLIYNVYKVKCFDEFRNNPLTEWPMSLGKMGGGGQTANKEQVTQMPLNSTYLMC